jgi:alkane 1-monooxygenase
MNAREWCRASGYLFIFLSPALLAAAMALDWPLLSFVGLIFVLPLLRIVFGDAPDRQPEWSEEVAQTLEFLPVAAGAVYAAAIAYVVYALSHSQQAGSDWFEIGLSVWASFIFASCVSHELLHRRDIVSRALGRVLSGMIGYPLQEHEHRAHHVQTGQLKAAECPAIDESVWRFTSQRVRHVVRMAWEGDLQVATRRGNRLSGGLPLSVGATVVTAVSFGLFAGLPGLLLYVIVALAVAWTMQAMTYVQHWGLCFVDASDGKTRYHAWEDRCQVQTWVTLGISYHQAHHQHTAVPYYRQNPIPGAPLQPGGYVVLLFVSMVPPLWRMLMTPALERWRRTPFAQRSAGRLLLCVKRSA